MMVTSSACRPKPQFPQMLAAQGSDSLSRAVVTAFVNDLSGSAPLSIADCDDSQQFSERISAFVSIDADVLHKRGMILNTKPSKSAIMASLAGPESVQAMHWLNDLQGHLTVTDFCFQLVHQYRLLGGLIDATSSLGPEVDSKQLAVTKISAPYHRYISTEPKLTMNQLVNCINSTLVSSLSMHTLGVTCLSHN